METMALGLLAVSLLLVSVCLVYYKKPVWGIVCGTASIASAYLTGASWKEMLTDSGKNTALLGFDRYPAAPIILGILFLAAAASVLAGIAAVVKKLGKVKKS